MTHEIDFVNVKTISGKHKSNDLFNWAVAEKITTENLRSQQFLIAAEKNSKAPSKKPLIPLPNQLLRFN